MGIYTAEVAWERGNEDFLGNQYSRKHLLRFDGGIEVAGSSSPQVLPPPLSETAAIDPEEAFVASISSCHMLWFLAIAAKRRFCVDSYIDRASGILEKNDEGRMSITKVTLRPEVKFSGDRLPDADQISALHHEAHEQCFIANSVKSEIECLPL